MKITREIDFTPTPKELAELFWEMDCEAQAMFFNSLYTMAGSVNLVGQLAAVSVSPKLTDFGRATMRVIGDYSHES